MSEPLASNILGTYSRLRRGMAVIAVLLPFVLWKVGEIYYATPLQPSISAYYHTNENLRDILVGVLVAVGTLLYLYKGETPLEDWLLNIAGVSAICVAGFEMVKGSDCSPAEGVTVHGFFAVLFFLAIFCVCLVDLRFFADKGHRFLALRGSIRGTWYRIFAVAMFLSIAAGVVYAFLLPAQTKLALCNKSITFWIESFGIWAFSAFWLLRTLELDKDVSWNPFRKDSET